MKILIFASELIHPPKGGLYEMTFNLIDSVREFDCELDIIGFSNSLSASYINKIYHNSYVLIFEKKHSWLICSLRYLLFPTYLLSFNERKLIRDINSKHYDWIIFEGIGSGGMVHKLYAKNKLVNVIDPQTLRHSRFIKLPSTKLIQKLKHMIGWCLSSMVEFLLFRKNVLFNVVSPCDKDYLAIRHKNSKFINIPVCVSKNSTAFDLVSKYFSSNFIKFVVFIDLTQSYLYDGFIRFYLEILVPFHETKKVETTVICRMLPENKIIDIGMKVGINFVEWADSLDDLMENVDAVLLPDNSGTGLKNRTIISLAYGKLTIGTESAFEGIPVSNGENALVVYDSSDWIKYFESVYLDRSLSSTIGNKARVFAKKHYSFDSYASGIRDLFLNG